MSSLYDFSSAMQMVFLPSLYTALASSSLIIVVLAIRVLPKVSKKRKYYLTITVQSALDLGNAFSVVIVETFHPFKIIYVGVFFYLISVMMNAFLAVYWMQLLIQPTRLNKALMLIIVIFSAPSLITTVYLAYSRDSRPEVTAIEWLLHTNSRTVTSIALSVVVLICLYRVIRASPTTGTPTTRRAHKKVSLGLAYKTMCALVIAGFGVNTLIGVIVYGTQHAYIESNGWWTKVYYILNNMYISVNAFVTLWMLSGEIRKRKTSPDTAVSTITMVSRKIS